jgi:hypothetical protein
MIVDVLTFRRSFMRIEVVLCKLHDVVVSVIQRYSCCFSVLELFQFLQFLLYTELPPLFSLRFVVPVVSPGIRRLNTLRVKSKSAHKSSQKEDTVYSRI